MQPLRLCTRSAPPASSRLLQITPPGSAPGAGWDPPRDPRAAPAPRPSAGAEPPPEQSLAWAGPGRRGVRGARPVGCRRGAGGGHRGEKARRAAGAPPGSLPSGFLPTQRGAGLRPGPPRPLLTSKGPSGSYVTPASDVTARLVRRDCGLGPQHCPRVGPPCCRARGSVSPRGTIVPRGLTGSPLGKPLPLRYRAGVRAAPPGAACGAGVGRSATPPGSRPPVGIPRSRRPRAPRREEVCRTLCQCCGISASVWVWVRVLLLLIMMII